MAPKKWTTPEQEKLLSDFLPEYRIHGQGRDYSQFWPKVHQTFFEKWPMREALFPDKPADEDLNEHERQNLSERLKKRKEVSSNTYANDEFTWLIKKTANSALVPLED
jgi:hypothetical protein